MKKNLIKSFKKAFSLAELLIVLTIIGVCCVMAITAMKPADINVTRYLYSNAYKALSKAYYNALLKGDVYNPFLNEDADNNNEDVKILCEGLKYFINTNLNEDYTCNQNKAIDLDGFDYNFNDDQIQFISNNKMKFYISKKVESADDIDFYIVFVDLNGVKKPNSIVYTYKGNEENEENKKLPDIYAFAMLNTGRVCPLGIPEYDSEVLTARFVYFNEGTEQRYYRKSIPYFAAKNAAWGIYDSAEEITPKDNYNLDEPFSMNDKIRAILDEKFSGNLITKDFPESLKDLDSYVELQDAEPFHCSNQDLESCYVYLDEYR